jgi:small nuclear ribonucleoprotein (snRNP)-like protein
MSASEEKMDKDEARGFLESLLNKKLRIHTTDERMFWGEFKCTDPVSRTSSLYRPSGA